MPPSFRRKLRTGRPAGESEVRHVNPDSEGVERARSASEAFLYRRLETLPETAGRFRLNAALPIPFDGQGKMEVDLLDAEARVAVELDGAQHLADPQAYRRDRRKDLLLQENGFIVLRFLSEDVRYLDCGDLHFGFGRVRCAACGHDFLLPLPEKLAATGLIPTPSC